MVWETVLYVNNLFDTNAKLAFDRERGGRARLGYHVGTPRTIGLTLRKAFLAAPPPPAAAAAAAAAASAAPAGDADLPRRIGDPGDGHLPATAAATATAAGTRARLSGDDQGKRHAAAITASRTDAPLAPHRSGRRRRFGPRDRHVRKGLSKRAASR